MKEFNEDELQFVARHYEEKALDTDRAWKRFRMLTGQNTHRINASTHRINASTRRISASTRRIAASVSIALIVGASLACGVWYARHWNASPTTPEVQTTTANMPFRYLQPAGDSIILKYDNAPIEDVLSELSAYYGREVVLQDASEKGRRIAGEIEATSLEEVVEILEATLDIEIEIQNK